LFSGCAELVTHVRSSVLCSSKYFSVHFFCSSKRNEPKKKRPETISLPFRYARYTGLIGATLQAKLRAVSGLPPRLEYSK
jgi:hypothetical protein